MGRAPFPADEARIDPAAALRWQQVACDELGAPLSAALAEHTAAGIETGTGAGPVLSDALGAAGLLDRDGRVRYGDLVGLRVLAVAHRAVLSRRAPALAVHYPTVGGTAPAAGPSGDPARAAAAAAFDEILLADPAALVVGLRRVPQTNETGRAPLLRHALARLVPPQLPVRLRECGASAGLNLRADRLPGHPDLEPPGTRLPRVVDRRGCDLVPLDPTTPEGRLALSSYVWADDAARFDRLGRALRVAVEVPAVVEATDAASFLEAQQVRDGTALVVWHSAMWVYLDLEQRRRVLAAIGRLGSEATAAAPVWHVSWEWRTDADDARRWFALVARGWPGGVVDGVAVPAGTPLLLATGSSHGGSLVAVRPAPALEVDPLRVA